MEEKTINRIWVLPLWGSSEKFESVEDALKFVKGTDFSVSSGNEPFVRLEVQIRYSHGLLVDLTGEKIQIVEYLENIHKVLE